MNNIIELAFGQKISLDITQLFVQGNNDIHLCPYTLTANLYRTTVKRNETVRLAVINAAFNPTNAK